jgi:hypothetical protein
MVVSCLTFSSALKMEATCSFKRSVDMQKVLNSLLNKGRFHSANTIRYSSNNSETC